MNYIVIGSSGFIGSKIYASLKFDPNNNVVGISSRQVDLSNRDSLQKLNSIVKADSIIIMCAGVKKQLGDNIDVFEKNLVIINNFIRVILNVIPKKIIFFSSASVYGEDFLHINEIDENTSVENRSYYGMGKYMSELLLTKACEEVKTELVILRPPLIYGHGDLSFGYGPTGFLRKALDGEEIIMWGDGTELREFVYINDVVGIVKTLTNSDFIGVLNLVSGTSYNYLDVTRILRDYINIDFKVSSRPRSKDKVDHVFSNKRIMNTTNDFCFTNLEAGMKMMYESMNIKKK